MSVVTVTVSVVAVSVSVTVSVVSVSVSVSGGGVCAVLALAYSPNGRHLAVATLNGHISVMDVQSEDITQTIEGRHDLGYTRREADKITAKRSADGKLVTC